MLLRRISFYRERCCGSFGHSALRSVRRVLKPNLTILHVARHTSKDTSSDEEYIKAKKVLHQCFEPAKPMHWDIGTINPYFIKCFETKKPVGKSPEECKAIINSLFGQKTLDDNTQKYEDQRKLAIVKETARIETLAKSVDGFKVPTEENKIEPVEDTILAQNQSLKKNIFPSTTDETCAQLEKKEPVEDIVLVQNQVINEKINTSSGDDRDSTEFVIKKEDIALIQNQSVNNENINAISSYETYNKQLENNKEPIENEMWVQNQALKSESINTSHETQSAQLENKTEPVLYTALGQNQVINEKSTNASSGYETQNTQLENEKKPVENVDLVQHQPGKERSFNATLRHETHRAQSENNIKSNEKIVLIQNQSINEESINASPNYKGINSDSAIRRSHLREGFIFAKDSDKTRPISTSENIPVSGEPMVVGEYARLPRKDEEETKKKDDSKFDSHITRITQVDTTVEETNIELHREEENYAFDPLSFDYKNVKESETDEYIELKKYKKLLAKEVAEAAANAEIVPENVGCNETTTEEDLRTLYEKPTEQTADYHTSSVGHHLIDKSVSITEEPRPLTEMLHKLREISKAQADNEVETKLACPPKTDTACPPPNPTKAKNDCPPPKPPKPVCPPPKPKSPPPKPKCPPPKPDCPPQKPVCPPSKPESPPTKPKCPPPKCQKTCCSPTLGLLEPMLPTFHDEESSTVLSSPYTPGFQTQPLLEEDNEDTLESPMISYAPACLLIPPIKSDFSNDMEIFDIFSYPCEPFQEPFPGLNSRPRPGLGSNQTPTYKLKLKKKPDPQMRTKDAIILTLFASDPIVFVQLLKGLTIEEMLLQYIWRIRGKSYDPWVPIPSYTTVNRKAKPCGPTKRECPSDLPKLIEGSKENPCKMLPRWTNARYMLDYLLLKLFHCQS